MSGIPPVFSGAGSLMVCDCPIEDTVIIKIEAESKKIFFIAF
jgi:hypothetical protein